jgi:hypothetical protein
MQLFEEVTRHEPQTLGKRSVPADPYAAWLKQRKQESVRESRPHVRWVYRYRGVGTPVASGIIAGAREIQVREQESCPPVVRLAGV